MLKTVGQLKDRLSATLEGVNVDTINDLNGGIEQAARILSQQVYIPEAILKQNINLYGGVTDYLSDDSVFGTSLVDFRPYGVSRVSSDRVYKQGIEPFDRTNHQLPNGYVLTFEYDDGIPIVRVNPPTTLPTATLDDLDDDDWTLAGSASGLAVDETDYYESPNSLRFLLTGSSTGTVTKAIDSLDLTDYENVGVAFLAIKVPTATSLTSLTLRLGSSASAYDEVSSVTSGFLGAWQDDEWTLVAFDFSTAVSTGTPVWSALDYAQIQIAHTATITNFRIGALFISLPKPHKLICKTAAIFKASGQNPSQTITSDQDEVILTDSAYLLLEKQVAFNIEPKRVDIQRELYGNGNDVGLYARFRSDNPSQEVKQTNVRYPVRGFKKK